MNQPKEQVEVPEAGRAALVRAMKGTCCSFGAPPDKQDWVDREYNRAATKLLTAALPAIEQAVEERVRERLEALDRYAFFDGNEEGCGGAEMLPNGGWLDRADVLAALSQSHNTEEEK